MDRIITIVSPDKITPSMFIDFYEKLYGDNKIVLVRDINFLYSKPVQEMMFVDALKEAKEKGLSLIVKYTVKPNTDLSKYMIPMCFLDDSDLVIKFDMYSTKPEVIKDRQESTALLEKWEANIASLNRT